MDRAESKYSNTARRMDRAFLDLLDRKDFAYITVKELCQAAGVNRSTFYLHYETMGDLLSESVEAIMSEFLDYMQRDTGKFIRKLRDCPREELYLITPEYLTPYLSFIREHQRLMQTALAHAATLGLENSYAGEVGAVMDLLFSGELYINQVMDLEIDHSLLGVEGAAPDTVRTVVSHPQALRQCDDYIKRHGYATETYSNTALAAAHVRGVNDPALAAIASEEAAEVFGLRVLERGINTVRTNTTRFAALSRTRSQPETTKKREDENFVLVFTVQNDAGSLAQTLNIIGAHGYNMRTLRSRPMRGLSWKYYFYVEAEGCVNNTNGREMLQELSATCAKLRLVGSYYANTI